MGSVISLKKNKKRYNIVKDTIITSEHYLSRIELLIKFPSKKFAEIPLFSLPSRNLLNLALILLCASSS